MNDSDHDAPRDATRQHLDPDRCIDLVHGLVIGEERDRIVAHLLICPLCERRLRDGYVARQVARAALPEVFAELERERARRRAAPPAPVSREAVRTSRSWLRWTGVAVAAAAVLLVVFWPRQAPVSLAPDLRLLPVLASADDLRGPAGLPAEFQAALQSYQRREFALAIERLRGLAIAPALQPARDLFLGSALAWAGRPADAIAPLESALAATIPEPWEDEGRWTLLCAYDRIGATARADSLLVILAATPGEIGARARSLHAAR